MDGERYKLIRIDKPSTDIIWMSLIPRVDVVGKREEELKEISVA